MIKEVLSFLFKKPATTGYPFVKPIVPQTCRGRIQFFPEKCIGCQMCVRDCPAAAIAIRKVGDKRFECEFNLGKCIYCGQCVDSCMKKALECTNDFELAQLDRTKLIRVTQPAPAPKPEENPEQKPQE
jgi:formate hydrogenlyase subunit 6/NADH:ubiquinone oxidoreductase subunit I